MHAYFNARFESDGIWENDVERLIYLTNIKKWQRIFETFLIAFENVWEFKNQDFDKNSNHHITYEDR